MRTSLVILKKKHKISDYSTGKRLRAGHGSTGTFLFHLGCTCITHRQGDVLIRNSPCVLFYIVGKTKYYHIMISL